MMPTSPTFGLGFMIIISVVATADLRVGFYDFKCPQAESIILSVVRKNLRELHSEPAWLLRLYFNDCFHTGCDASLLIDSTKNHQAEKDAPDNQGMIGSSIIDEAKLKLEEQCLLSVSCADIITLATRDAVAFSGDLNFSVPTGRRDGMVSNAKDVVLPGPNITVAKALKMFSDKNLTLEDMVTLIGGHSIGAAHCNFFQDRVFNFNGKNGTSDPKMDFGLKANLTRLCTGASLRFYYPDPYTRVQYNPTTFLDQRTPFMIDNVYYSQLLANKGVLQIEQDLVSDKATARIVSRYASHGALFRRKFAEALIKLGNVGVLVGGEGEIRKNCGAFNSPSP